MRRLTPRGKEAQALLESARILVRDRIDDIYIGGALQSLADALEIILGSGSDAPLSYHQGPPVPRRSPLPAETPVTPTPKCPQCGADSVERTNKVSGVPFRGCSAWPKCRWSLRPARSMSFEEDEEIYDVFGPTIYGDHDDGD